MCFCFFVFASKLNLVLWDQTTSHWKKIHLKMPEKKLAWVVVFLISCTIFCKGLNQFPRKMWLKSSTSHIMYRREEVRHDPGLGGWRAHHVIRRLQCERLHWTHDVKRTTLKIHDARNWRRRRLPDYSRRNGIYLFILNLDITLNHDFDSSLIQVVQIKIFLSL